MGYTRWDADEWDSHATTTASKPRAAVFTSTTVKKALDPVDVKVREAFDSDANPNSTPIIIAFDVTGSMGDIPDYFVRTGAGTLVEEILKRKPVTDPQFMMMAVGDAYCDRYPLQVGQFEADITSVKQLEQMVLEGGGGGNDTESYDLPWLFAATKTKIDCVTKGRRKGILFTIGDEQSPNGLTVDQARRALGDELTQNLTAKDILTKVEQMYDVFHVVVEQGDYCSRHKPEVMKSWTALLGQQRVIPLADYKKLAEVLVSAIEVHEGRYAADVTASWSPSTAMVVSRAVGNIVPAAGKTKAKPGAKPGGVLRLGGGAAA